VRWRTPRGGAVRRHTAPPLSERLGQLLQRLPARTSSAAARPVRTTLPTLSQPLSRQFQSYLLRHLQTLIGTLGDLYRRPIATLLTCAVIGIALALPAGLYQLLSRVGELTKSVDEAGQISLFLHAHVTTEQAAALAQRLQRQPAVGHIEHITAASALAEFRQLSGFGAVIDTLSENPLPELLVVRPLLRQQSAEQIERLLGELRQLPEVDQAQLDIDWLQRLYAMMALTQRGILILGLLLALAILLVVGNTIRLLIQNRADEIVITRLIGGTDAFIRRPFLYSGLWYGFGGGVVALLLVESGLLALAAPVSELAALYHSQFQIGHISLSTLLLLPSGGAVLGLCGAWLAVAQHLRGSDPQ